MAYFNRDRRHPYIKAAQFQRAGDGHEDGWCQCAPLAWFPKLVQQRTLADESPEGVRADA